MDNPKPSVMSTVRGFVVLTEAFDWQLAADREPDSPLLIPVHRISHVSCSGDGTRWVYLLGGNTLNKGLDDRPIGDAEEGFQVREEFHEILSRLAAATS